MPRAAVSRSLHAPLVALALLVLVSTLVTVPASGAAAAVAVDRLVGRRDCALAGRDYVPGAGCARHRCVPGARPYKEGRDAELCERPGRRGAPYGQPIDSRRCRDLGRVWIGEINICASNPDRSRGVVPRAPQCANPAATYLNHREVEGYFDECLAPHRVRRLQRLARKQEVTLARAALDRGRANCSYRPGWVMEGGVCVVRQGPPPAADLGGLLMTGDSVSWRAWDELHARAPRWELDLRPGRRLDELADRLAWYRADHGDPDQIVIQLGTNRRSGYTERDFRATMATIPAGTPVLMLLPYRRPSGENANLVAATRRYARWMRALAAERPLTCLADWPSFAARHRSNLVDGEHPDRQHEDWYARYVLRAWDDCPGRTGRGRPAGPSGGGF